MLRLILGQDCQNISRKNLQAVKNRPQFVFAGKLCDENETTIVKRVERESGLIFLSSSTKWCGVVSVVGVWAEDRLSSSLNNYGFSNHLFSRRKTHESS